MRRTTLVTAFAVSCVGSVLGPTPSLPAPPHRGAASLFFERNDGQHPRPIRFVARGDGYRAALMDDRLLLSLTAAEAESQIAIRFEPAAASPVGDSALTGTVNYLVGTDPNQWRTNIPAFKRVRYAGDGIDLVFYGNGPQLEYDMVVAPGADVGRARIAFDGPQSLALNADGSLTLAIDGRELTSTRPIAYQMIAGVQREVDVAYRSVGNAIAFDVGEYDRTHELVIDPVLVFSTYLGGSSRDSVNDVAVDAAGATYAAGFSLSNHFPVTAGAPQSVRRGPQDAVVTKLDRYGALVYSTYFGGASSDDATGIAVDATGAAYVTGFTASDDLPVSSNAFQRTPGGDGDGYVLKLNPAGNRIAYLTYLGGSNVDAGSADIAVDASGIATVVGATTSIDYPTTPGAWMQSRQGTSQIGYATRLNAAGSALIYSTLLTGTTTQFAHSVALDAAGRAVVAGFVLGAMTTTTKIGTGDQASEAYVLKLNNSGTGVVFSTLLGGSSFDTAFAVGVDPVDDATVVAGQTQSSDFPTSSGAHHRDLRGSADAYVMWLDRQGELLFSTLLGGNNTDTAIAIGVAHNAVTVFGQTQSTDFPMRSPLQTTLAGQLDAFVTRLSFGEIQFSTYLGGARADWALAGAVDGAGAMTVAGYTFSGDYPTAHASQPSPGQPQRDVTDGFISRASIRARGTPGPEDVVVHAAAAATLHGDWFREPDDTAASGAALHNPNAGAAKPPTAMANPADYFEFTVDGLGHGPYMLWIRGRADGDAYTNDSVFVQFSEAFDADDSPAEHQIYRIGTTDGLPVVIEDCPGCGLRGWGWQDGGYGFRVSGPPLYFNAGQPQTIRVQRREDGISIDQIVLAGYENGAGPNFRFAPGYQKDDDTIVAAQDGGGTGGGALNVVVYPGVDGAQLHGAWSIVADSSAAGGKRVSNPDASAAKLAAPLPSPADYFDLEFEAKAGVAYRLWIRGRADADFWGNDSAYIQFSGSVTGTGSPTWRIGTTSATTYTLENCIGCGLRGWGWNDNSYEGVGPVVYFSSDGPQTIRVQRREDGLSIDQIVLSPAQYIDAAPGAAKNDTVIVPR